MEINRDKILSGSRPDDSEARGLSPVTNPHQMAADGSYGREAILATARPRVPRRVPQFSTVPTISGTAQVGETLTATPPKYIAAGDGEGAETVAIAWLDDGVVIGGATSSTYELTVSEEGGAITVRYTVTSSKGDSASVTSEATAAVIAA